MMGLKRYPATRFAYAVLTLVAVISNWDLIVQLVHTSEYKLCKRSNPGKKARYVRFEGLVNSASTKTKFDAARQALGPGCTALHYTEGDSAPIEHVVPIFATLYQQCQSPSDDMKEVFSETTLEAIVKMHRERWLGENRKVGVRHKAHCLAYGLSIPAQMTVKFGIGEEWYNTIGCSFKKKDEEDAIKQWCDFDDAKSMMMIKQYDNYKAGRGAFEGRENTVVTNVPGRVGVVTYRTSDVGTVCQTCCCAMPPQHGRGDEGGPT